MAGLPLKPYVFVRYSLKHHFPGGGIVRNVPVSPMPVAPHIAVFKRQPDLFVRGLFRERQKNLFEAIHQSDDPSAGR